jgi:HEPN superfamily protein
MSAPQTVNAFLCRANGPASTCIAFQAGRSAEQVTSSLVDRSIPCCRLAAIRAIIDVKAMDNESVQPNLTGLSDADALEQIGLLIDTSCDRQSQSGTDQALALLDEFGARRASPDLVALAHYYRANAWANREQVRKNPDVWSWEQPECQEQTLELRRAVRHDGFPQLTDVRQCQILVNLANQLDKIGRFIEAVEIYDRALSIEHRFGMARGNRGIALSHYAHALYDGGQTTFMLIAAHEALISAVPGNGALYENPHYKEATSAFMAKAQQIESHMDVQALRQSAGTEEYGLGESEEEQHYRAWCLDHRLFMNPLNELGALPIAAQDVLTLPSLTVPAGTAGLVPGEVGFFNQIKQEFVSARYLYYEGLRGNKSHFSDRDVLLYNTLDYPAYSLATEKMRAAFRLAYSLFDKISFFLNHYFELGHHLNKVSFRSVWYEGQGSPSRPLLGLFNACQNWPLRGLFWLSKDLFEDEFQNVTEPDAESLNEIRNHLEHKYLQLNLELVPPGSGSLLGYSIYKQDFAARTLRLLKLARAALIYLSLAVWSEERQRVQRRGPKPTASMPLFVWQDEWKQ